MVATSSISVWEADPVNGFGGEGDEAARGKHCSGAGGSLVDLCTGAPRCHGAQTGPALLRRMGSGGAMLKLPACNGLPSLVAMARTSSRTPGSAWVANFCKTAAM